jgi:hypothetical protein
MSPCLVFEIFIGPFDFVRKQNTLYFSGESPFAFIFIDMEHSDHIESESDVAPLQVPRSFLLVALSSEVCLMHSIFLIA